MKISQKLKKSRLADNNSRSLARGLTKTFKQLSKKDVGIAGGKGASLGEMTQVGIPVPLGFVVLASAFDRFLEETDIDVEIEAIFHKTKV